MASALRLERIKYQDILLSGPEDGLAAVEDSYLTLSQKSTAFMQWALQAAGGSLRVVLMIDDDVYLDMPGFAQWLASGIPMERFYGGEVSFSILLELLTRIDLIHKTNTNRKVRCMRTCNIIHRNHAETRTFETTCLSPYFRFQSSRALRWEMCMFSRLTW